MPKTLYEKIVAAHTVKRIDAATVLLYCDVHFASQLPLTEVRGLATSLG